MNAYKNLVRPIAFRFPAEAAHNMAHALLSRPYLGGVFGACNLGVSDERLKVDLGGLVAPNPVGLSAGLDKDCDMARSLTRLGFGYIVSGSVMRRPRPGNPRPRMVRAPEQQAIYSCMGLPSQGLQYALKQLRTRRHSAVPVVVNFNAETYQEYVEVFRALQPVSDALEISLFCPNRPSDSGDFLRSNLAGCLLAELVKNKKRPLFVKIPGYTTEDERRKRLELVEALRKYPIDGFTICPEGRVPDSRLSLGRGTLSGRPLFQQMLGVVRDIYALTGKDFAIKASGGIFTYRDAFSAINAGATSVEVYSAFIYEGWAVAKAINRGLLALMNKYDVDSVQTLRGCEIELDQ